MKPRSPASANLSPAELVWSHYGRRYRVTAQPDLRFEYESEGRWLAYEPDPSDPIFASAAQGLSRSVWERFLGFVPPLVREFVAGFQSGRLAALAVIVQCPSLQPDLATLPALAPFLAAHVELRGSTRPRWEEIEAVHERGGLFGLLEWLGLPASRQAVAVLARIVDPDLPQRLLAPMRAALWEPQHVWLLQRCATLTERELSHRCHALAA